MASINSFVQPFKAPPIAPRVPIQRQTIICQSQQTIDRRTLLTVTTTLLTALVPLEATAATTENTAVTAGLNKYIKRKKLDNIDTYIPQLISAKDQLVRVGRILNNPADARQQLRSGVFKGIRSNIRAVGEYVADRKTPEEGSKIVSNFFSALEGLDTQLLKASRSEDAGAYLEEATKLLKATVSSLDDIIAALPASSVAAAEKVLQAVQEDEVVVMDEEAVLTEAAKLKGLF